MCSFDILPYTEDNLLALLVNPSSSETSIRNKNHFLFLTEYLGSTGLNAKSIIVEDKYISLDFFSDFSAYYALCFRDYSKYCKRIHFFNSPVTESEFKRIIFNPGENNQDFDNSYLGFIVIKPLPYTIIGTTLLKTYSNNQTNREYFGTRIYKSHLFGYQLQINSLAFQEQDSVLSACATTAIWTTLHKAAEIDYHVTIKTPFEITRDAGLMSPNGGRLFPNKQGLSLVQMCQALTVSGLVVEVRNCFDAQGNLLPFPNAYLKKLLYAYSPIGIPVILVVNVPFGDTYGLHALAVNGYKYQRSNPQSPRAEISWKADDLEKIYVHDDQWGPFARVEFGNNDTLNTNWSRFHPSNNPTVTHSVLIPVFPKIRLSYDDIEAITIVLDELLSDTFNQYINFDFYWDIRVQFSEDYKQEIKKSDAHDTIKEKVQFSSYPKYLWISTCYVGDFKVFDFLADGTDIAYSMFMIDIVSYNDDIRNFFHSTLSTNPGYVEMFKHPNKELFFKFLIQKLS